MKNVELVCAVSSRVNLSRGQVIKTIDVILDEIIQTLSKGDKVMFMGFGTFKVVKKPARNGRDYRTGASIRIPERNAAKFTPGKKLKEALRSSNR